MKKIYRSSRIRLIMTVGAVNLISAILVILLFDVLMFFFLPERFAPSFFGYRDDSTSIIGGRASYPRGYFATQHLRGFDIAPNRAATHWVDGVEYPIWSNSHGCFDREHPRNEEYVYFAGDSFTWGYTPYDFKFGTVVENNIRTPVYKCGVTHTGQQHQYEKLLDIVEATGTMPRAMLVFYTFNDVANDYAHPHTTVVDGWQADSIMLGDENDLVGSSRVQLVSKLHDRLAYLRSPVAQGARVLRRYSLSAHLMRGVLAGIKMVPGATTWGTTVRNLYDLPFEANGRYWFLDNPYAENNKKAIRSLKTVAVENDTELVFVLIPRKEAPTDTEWYQEVRNFLDANDIRYLDLASAFRERLLTVGDLFWQNDPHLSVTGNLVVAEVIMKELQDVLY